MISSIEFTSAYSEAWPGNFSDAAYLAIQGLRWGDIHGYVIAGIVAHPSADRCASSLVIASSAAILGVAPTWRSNSRFIRKRDLPIGSQLIG